MKSNTFNLLAGLVLVGVAVAAYWLWPRPVAPVEPAPYVVTEAQSAPAAMASAPLAAASASEPEVIASASEPVPDVAVALPALAQSDPVVKNDLIALLGKPSVLKLLQTDDFLRRVVATVDNLTRPHAAARLWPVNPTEGKFTVTTDQQIAPDNAARYETFVKFVEGVDPARAAKLYQRLYPLLQQAYEELGYPNQRFHGRLLAVIDHLLATPQRSGPLAVTLTEVKGPIPSERPWVRYEFADPQLQALSSGQKIMLRIGEVNQRRLRAWLSAFRKQIER